MRIRLAIPDRLVTPQALEAALEATMLANEQAIARGEVPHAEDAIRAGARWRPEPYTDGEHFDLAHQVIRRNWGDCDDWAPWQAASMRASGEDAGAVPRVYKTGKNRWHVVVQTSDGRILDPSRWAGMGRRSAPSSAGVVGMVARPFARPHGGAIAVVPHGGRWWARCDVPWPDGSGHIASHARARTPSAALHRAVSGALVCGEEIDSPLVERAGCAGELLLSPAQEVGSLFGGLLKAALPIASSFIPGGSLIAPLAGKAVDMLTHGGGGAAHQVPGASALPGGGVAAPLESQAPEGHEGHQHMMLFYHPQGHPGPVVMRF